MFEDLNPKRQLKFTLPFGPADANISPDRGRDVSEFVTAGST